MSGSIHVKRAYDPPEASDGTRVLVDRLWPRGLSKAHAHIDFWLKDVAPSDALRKRFHHEPAKWPAFVNDYRHELEHNRANLEQLLQLCRDSPVTLLYSAHDTEHNNAVLLATVLAEHLREQDGSEHNNDKIHHLHHGGMDG
ncbi:hypothetical protein CDCA_CDCA08G2285 [Cyanidium caldarium]|uniref:DUF488 domain-containing protein n=1 Tax=Cyanidium caldarium TaxID=2771 RepID=A0AAV9IVW5_CYACA|nr:hypothetical protein CDCA_CDCA08G2285 [Cyanidium caldarium]